MSKTPVSVTFRADEWVELCLILEFAAAEFDGKDWDVSATTARKRAAHIYRRVEQSK